MAGEDAVVVAVGGDGDRFDDAVFTDGIGEVLHVVEDVTFVVRVFAEAIKRNDKASAFGQAEAGQSFADEIEAAFSFR
jgi:hypothetical protein